MSFIGLCGTCGVASSYRKSWGQGFTFVAQFNPYFSFSGTQKAAMQKNRFYWSVRVQTVCPLFCRWAQNSELKLGHPPYSVLHRWTRESPACSCLSPAKSLEQGYHPCCRYLLLLFLGVGEDQKICGRNQYRLDPSCFMAMFIFWVDWDPDSLLQKQVPACLLPRPFPGHWHSTVSAPRYAPMPTMAVAGTAPSLPWTVQLFGRVMLTEGKKHLILHLSVQVYCIVQSHWEYKGHSCSAECVLCSDNLNRMKFLPGFFFWVRLSHWL